MDTVEGTEHRRVPVVEELLAFRETLRPDDVSARYHELGTGLTIRVLPAEEDDVKPMVLLEGDRRALLFLADLILAQAADEGDCGFQIDCPEPGLLSARSECGLYIHSLPCADLKREAP